jgi:hypothetical protein
MGLGRIAELGLELGIGILKKKNTDNDRKYIDDYYEAKKNVMAEKAKPSSDQMDNLIEQEEKKAELLLEAARMSIEEGQS